jgi:hypothetical protein
MAWRRRDSIAFAHEVGRSICPTRADYKIALRIDPENGRARQRLHDLGELADAVSP